MANTAYTLKWDETGKRLYETGIKNGVLYVYDSTNNKYGEGVAWNGLTAVTESPSGAEATALYADNIKYLNLMSAEEFGGTIEAYMYPDEFKPCNGEIELNGMTLAAQTRKTFGLCYRTTIGNDTDGNDHGYKIHLVYGALAAVSEKAYATINDSPEAITFSWEFTTTPVAVTIDGVEYKPTACITIDSTKFTDETKAHLAALEKALYGDGSAKAELPMPSDVYSLITTGQKVSG